MKKCGTLSGPYHHKKIGENSCYECIDFRTAYAKNYRLQKPWAHRKATAKYRASQPKHPRPIPTCGTVGAYQRHLRLKKKPCKPCQIAAKDYRKSRDPEVVREANKKWRRENPEKNSESRRRTGNKRRALKQGNTTEQYTETDVITRWGTTCHICYEEIDFTASRGVGRLGWERGLHMDHVIAIFNGGENTLENVKPAHGLCNLRKWAF